MNKSKFLMFMSLILAVVVFAWLSGDVFAKTAGTKDTAKAKVTKDGPVKEKGAKPDVVKGKVTRDDGAAYFGKVKPSEQKAAQKRARLLGLKPGIAGRAAQVPGPAGAPRTN